MPRYYLAFPLPLEMSQQIRCYANFIGTGRVPSSLAHITIIHPFGIPHGQEHELLPLLEKVAKETDFPVTPFPVCFDEIAVWEGSSGRTDRFFVVAMSSSAEQCQKLAEMRTYYQEKYAGVLAEASCSVVRQGYNPHINLLKRLTLEEATHAKSTFGPLLPLTWTISEPAVFPESGTLPLAFEAVSTAPPG